MKYTRSSTQHFYQNGELAAVKKNEHYCRVFRDSQMPLVELHTDGTSADRLLATDLKTSALYSHDRQQSHAYTYTPYGHTIDEADPQILIAFNGQRRDSFTGFYMLGNGHRSFSPALSRFLTTDSLSPFGTGGINAYSYCGNDPINRSDPTGQSWMSLFKGIANLFGRTRSRDRMSTNPMRQTVSDPNLVHREIAEGRRPPTFEQALSDDLALPTYQFVEDNISVKVQRLLQQNRERTRIVTHDIRHMKRMFGEAPQHMTDELLKLKNRSLRLRSNSHIDLSNAVLSPNNSTAIVNSRPPLQNQNVQRVRQS